MESFAIYLIKVNVALIVLYAFYKLSFSKDTFFRLDGRVCNRRNDYYRLQ